MCFQRWRHTLSGVLIVLVLAACGAEAEGSVGIFTGAPDQPLAGLATAGGTISELNIESAEGAILEFAQQELQAKTGTVQLTFNNVGVVPHNWTLARSEEEAQEINQQASTNPPEYQAEAAVAQTATIEGGAEDTIQFTLTEPGTYIYLCTYPGHFQAGMVGVLNVEQGEESGASPGTEAGGEGGAELVSNSAEGAILAYAETELTAPAGTVELTFNNVGVVPHNWTLVEPEREQEVATEAQNNPPNYEAPSAIAQTALLENGGTDTISFEVAPGTYSFICTYPGHYTAGMKGTLIVE